MSAALSNVNSRRIEAENRACERLKASLFPKEIAMIISVYVPKEFELLTLFHDLTCHQFFQEKWPNLEKFQKTVTVANDEKSLSWCVFSYEKSSLLDGNTFHICQIRFFDSTWEYGCIVETYDQPIEYLSNDKGQIKIKKPPRESGVTDDLLPKLEARYPNAEALANALSNL